MSEYLPDKPFFRPDEVAKYLSVSRATIYRWIDEGRLQSVRIGEKVVRVRRESVLQLVREN
jgi:excisionase family DNA binding protein